MRYVFVVLIVLATTPVHALTVTGAKIDKGAVQVKGKGAVPFARLIWEGQAVGQASKSGAFKFATAVLPADCVGDVSDGGQSAGAVIQGCSRGAGVLTPMLVDVNGVAIGIYAAESERLANILRVVNGITVSVVWSPYYMANGLLLGQSRLYYPNDGCVGAPVIGGPVSGLFLGGMPAAVFDATLYYPAGPAGLVSVESYRDPFDPGTCRDVSASSSADAMATGTEDLSGFVPPFRVELR